jgi:subtilisin family serine protease
LPSGARVLVHFKDDASAAARATAIRGLGATVDTELTALGITRLALPSTDEDALAAARRIARDPAVAFAEPDSVVRTELVPNDAMWFTDSYTELGQWAWRKALVDRAWDNARGSARVTVAVIDTGVDSTHPDLADVVLPGATFLSVPSSSCGAVPGDDNSHGTHVAGIIAALGNNGIGIAGVAFGVRILSIKALDCTGTGATSDIAQAIVWATDHGARIANISLGSMTDTATLRSAVQYATDHNMLIVAATGNCGLGSGQCLTRNVPEYPSALPGVLGVGATTSDDSVATFSTRGPQVAVTAPGIRTVSTTPRYPTFLSSRGLSPSYGALSGTSQASAFVSGVAALILSNEPGLSAAAVLDRITTTADDLGPAGRDDGYGAGRINAFRAVSYAGVGQGFAATYDARAVARAASAGDTFTTTVTVTNDSAVAWKATGVDAVRLAYHWIDRTGSTAVWDGLRTGLPADVAPGATATIAARVTAPAVAATYVLRFDLVRDGVAWFSDRGVKPIDVSVSVNQGFAAVYAPGSVPTTIPRASALTLPVKIMNTGARAWTAAGPSPVRLAYHWLRTDGTVAVWDGARAAPFAADVPPGTSVDVRLVVAAPSAPGTYVLRIDLVQEGVAWFSQWGIVTRDEGFVIN